MADLVAEEQRPSVNVFNSDDDLASFLAGLRAKYAKFQQDTGPEVQCAQQDVVDGNNDVAALASDDSGLVGTSDAFQQKLSQLRSSLQSLQHLLPPRVSTTANLLDSFTAVSNPANVESGGAQTASLSTSTLYSRPAYLSLPAALPSPPAAADFPTDAAPILTQISNPDTFETNITPASPRPLTSSASINNQPPAPLEPVPYTDTSHVSDHSSAFPFQPDVDPSLDSAFVELADGYSRRCTQQHTDSCSEVSVLSDGGEPSVSSPPLPLLTSEAGGLTFEDDYQQRSGMGSGMGSEIEGGMGDGIDDDMGSGQVHWTLDGADSAEGPLPIHGSSAPGLSTFEPWRVEEGDDGTGEFAMGAYELADCPEEPVAAAAPSHAVYTVSPQPALGEGSAAQGDVSSAKEQVPAAAWESTKPGLRPTRSPSPPPLPYASPSPSRRRTWQLPEPERLVSGLEAHGWRPELTSEPARFKDLGVGQIALTQEEEEEVEDPPRRPIRIQDSAPQYSLSSVAVDPALGAVDQPSYSPPSGASGTCQTATRESESSVAWDSQDEGPAAGLDTKGGLQRDGGAYGGGQDDEYPSEQAEVFRDWEVARPVRDAGGRSTNGSNGNGMQAEPWSTARSIEEGSGDYMPESYAAPPGGFSHMIGQHHDGAQNEWAVTQHEEGAGAYGVEQNGSYRPLAVHRGGGVDQSERQQRTVRATSPDLSHGAHGYIPQQQRRSQSVPQQPAPGARQSYSEQQQQLHPQRPEQKQRYDPSVSPSAQQQGFSCPGPAAVVDVEGMREASMPGEAGANAQQQRQRRRWGSPLHMTAAPAAAGGYQQEPGIPLHGPEPPGTTGTNMSTVRGSPTRSAGHDFNQYGNPYSSSSWMAYGDGGASCGYSAPVGSPVSPTRSITSAAVGRVVESGRGMSGAVAERDAQQTASGLSEGAYPVHESGGSAIASAGACGQQILLSEPVQGSPARTQGRASVGCMEVVVGAAGTHRGDGVGGAAEDWVVHRPANSRGGSANRGGPQQQHAKARQRGGSGAGNSSAQRPLRLLPPPLQAPASQRPSPSQIDNSPQRRNSAHAAQQASAGIIGAGTQRQHPNLQEGGGLLQAADVVLHGSPLLPPPEAPCASAAASAWVESTGAAPVEDLNAQDARVVGSVVGVGRLGSRKSTDGTDGTRQHNNNNNFISNNYNNNSNTSGGGNGDSGAGGITANRGGVAFSISLQPGGAPNPRSPSPAATTVPQPAGTISLQHQHQHHLLTAPPPTHNTSVSVAAAGTAAAGPVNWDGLNRQLMHAGFLGLVMLPPQLQAPRPQQTQSGQQQQEPESVAVPELCSVYQCLSSVLEQYLRRNRVVAEVLEASDQSRRAAEQQEATMREMQREVNTARAAAERARRELADLSAHQVPKAEARHAAQLARVRSESAKLKEKLRETELDLGSKVEEIRSLRAKIAGLQSASSHSADVEGAALRQRVAQLEGLLRARDKEVEKLKTTKEVVVGQAEDGQANALDRAYEAEGAARRLEAEVTAARTRIGQLEQALRQRERDVVTMREDLQQIKACEAAATLAAQDRGVAAEEAARRAEGEVGALRGKVRELEGAVRAARQELEKQRAQEEALRASAYEEIFRLEDECRTLGTELSASRNRVSQLENVVRAKEREVARVKDEKEAAKAAERERARIAEDVSVKLESELTTVKVRLTQAEGALRTREREMARLAELLRQTQGAEADAWIKQAKTEEGSRKLENDFTSLRLRILQLEAALKGRDKECDKLARTVETLRTETHELNSKLAKSDEGARKSEAELATARGKVLSLEGHVRVKEREQERLVRVVAALKAGDTEVASRQAALEEATRRLEGQLAAAESRTKGCEGALRARNAEVERLNRQLEALKTAEFERVAQAAKSDEAARKQDTEAVALRQRVVQLESQLRGKDRELERAARGVEAARGAEADAARRLADTAATVARLEGEVTSGRQRAAQLGEALRARERELAAANRALEAQRSAEHEAVVVAGRTEEVARKLDGEAAELRHRLVQTEGQLRTREREAERQARALEAAQTAVADAGLRQAEAEAAVRRLDADAAGLRQRLAQAEGAVRTRERELERAEKAAEQAKAALAEVEARNRAAEASVVQNDSELSALRLRIAQLEVTARNQLKELDRLSKVADKNKAAEMNAAHRATTTDEAARRAESDLSATRTRLLKLESTLAARDKEMQRLQGLLTAAEAQASVQATRFDEFVRRVDGKMTAMKQQTTQVEAFVRNRDRQMTTLRTALEAAQAAEAQAAEQKRLVDEALRKVEADLVAERQRAVQLEGQVKSRDREVERLSRQLDAGRDQSNSAAAMTGREVTALKEAAAKSEAALGTARARVTQLESELLSKERQMEALQRLAGYSRAGDAEAAAAAEDRATRSEEAARKLDAELGALRMRYAQLEHQYRAREGTLDKLRAALAEKVAREERRLARDKAAYTRIRAAYVATMGPAAATGAGAQGTPGGGDGGAAGGQQKAAGAMAAAARELRPVEIVGLYEARREAAEQELAACRAEIRGLADQLRDAQNVIALKERSGAWATPQELSDMQARVIMLERRCSDLQREVDRSRLEAAEAARTAERRLAEAERRATQLKEDNEALVHELDGRPTHQEARSLKREVEILEKRLLQLKSNPAANGAGAEAEGGETALSIAVAGKARNAGAMQTTAQRIARDRAVHRLGLRALEDWRKDVLVDIVQDVCIELDLSDATTLPAAIRKTLRVVGAVPRMEAFIGAVCERVYRQGAAFVPPQIDGTTDPSRVLEVLSIWLGLLQEGAQMRATMRAITEALSSRAEGMAMPIHGPGDVLTSVRQLVEAEAVALTARESLAAATHHLAAQPEQLLSRLVSHFMRLFDCPSLEGVVPAVNRLYVTLNEQRNFARALAAALGLPSDAGATACMAKLYEVLDSAGAAKDDPAGVARVVGLGTRENNARGAVVGPVSPASVPAPVEVEVSATLEKLMSLFGVRSAAGVAEAADKAVARLRRLDEVLPRYQRLASQLFEALRCTSLEEIMPALKMALQSQGR